MPTSPTDFSSNTYDDSHNRDRIGPWREQELPPLDSFESETNFVVRAAAGSGKTTALVGRMVALVRSGIPVGDLTAITFTRKAAGEMNARLFDELQKARDRLPERSEENDRVEEALANVQSAFVGTIHSFCSRLLRERPLAAGLPPDFSAGLEDREERRLRERAWQDHLREMYQTEEGRQQIDALAEMGVDPQNLTSFFETLCTHSELEPYVDESVEMPNFDPAVQETVQKIQEWDSRRPNVLPKGRDAAMKKIDKAKRMYRLRDLDSPREKVEFLEVIAGIKPGSGKDVKNTYWSGEEIDSKAWAKEFRDEHLDQFQTSVLQPVLREWQAYVHRAVTQFARPAVDRYRTLRREEGLLTFHDLLAITRDLLRDNAGARRTIQKRYPRLLVDEFQDTDPVQAEILAFLSSQDPTEIDWTRCRPRDGSLFIVGDDKQSIYRFRRADKDVFDAFRKRIDREPNGEAVDLTKNFRSRAPICRWCNDAFSAIFSAEEHRDIQADYVPFQPERSDGPDGTAIRTKPVGNVYGNWGKGVAEKDATGIAQFIRAAMNGEAHPDLYRDEDGAVFRDGASYSDFLILTWRKKRLSIYADVLAKHGIPYTVTGSEDLGDTDELKALVDLLRAALRPDDPIAKIAYLKGDLVGCSDDDLYRFRQAGGQFGPISDPLPESVLGQLSEALRRCFEGGLGRLHKVRRIIHQTRPGVGIRQIVETFGLLAGSAHPSDPSEGSLRAGAVLRILSYVQHLGAEGLAWDEITEELDLVLQGEERLDGMTLETGSEDAVRVMNVHQAKGLEAPVVFLADPYARGREPETTIHLRRDEEEVVAPVVQGESYYQSLTHAPRGWHEDSDPGFKAEEERQEAAEDHRLLYVAATRAERLLVVSTYPKKESDGYWSPLYPHLRQAAVPELSIPTEDALSSTAAAQAPDLASARARRTERLESGRRATYTVRSVTEAKGEAEPAGGAGVSRVEGYGRAFGTALHELFELLIRHRADPPAMTETRVRPFLESAGANASDETVSAAIDMVERFTGSKVWDEVRRATDVMTEYPFAQHAVDGEGEARTSSPPESVTRGKIDLVYRTEGEWVLVDFKTDVVAEGAAGIRQRLGDHHPYRKQVRAYAEAWQDLTDHAPSRTGLWFASAGELVPVDVSPLHS